MTQRRRAVRRREERSQSAFVRGFIDDLDGGSSSLDGLLSQSAFVRGFIDDDELGVNWQDAVKGLNPRSCAASSMTWWPERWSGCSSGLNPRSCAASSMTERKSRRKSAALVSQSAFVRGFIDDRGKETDMGDVVSLNPRSCAASSMTADRGAGGRPGHGSQSAFVRGFIDDAKSTFLRLVRKSVSIRVRARLHR